ncbi:hypothetical protein DU30_15705 [Methanosarcina mazei]|uniref:DUF3644 domain-containing protein n=1 Tax=Methanosarcina mazei TaxID=2209 RepID=A0A0F8GKA0_METMZ|nr:hypothetical protein DU30_15705 [Methanosarcina mazei]
MSKRIPKRSKELLNKSVESCLLAVEVYNKPQTKFRSGGYIVLMTIAYTSLFHAIFEKSRTKYYHREKGSNKYIVIDGEHKAWELSDCLKEYFKNCGKEELPIRKNVEFFIPLRNKIEHRFMPELDDEIFGECQALLHNFEYILIKEFGEKYAIRENLVFSLQFAKTYPSSKRKESLVKQNKGFEKIKNYITDFRSSLDEETFTDQRYRFSVYLLPKLVNNEKKADYAIEWVNYDPKDSEGMKNYKQVIGIINEKVKRVSNSGCLRAKDVCSLVRKELQKTYGDAFKFSYSTHHPVCCMYYSIRPKKDDPNPEKTNPNYCVYDAVHKDYVYTKEWVEFLVKNLSNREELIKVLPTLKNSLQSFDNDNTSKPSQQLEISGTKTCF